MPETKIDSEGFVIDDEGNRILVNDEPIKVTNAQTKEQVEGVIKERLARQNEKIKALEAQAHRTPELEKLLDDEKKAKAELEEHLARARQEAEAEVSGQLEQIKQRAKEMEDSLLREREARVKDQVTTLILSKSGDHFVNPAVDLVPKLLSVHKREPVKDKAGKPVDGQFQDLFRMSYKDEKGQDMEELVPIEKAVEIVVGQPQYRHYLKATGNGGSGGGQYTNHANLKRSEMTAAQKADFAGKHGLEAYQKLPE